MMILRLVDPMGKDLRYYSSLLKEESELIAGNLKTRVNYEEKYA